MALPLFAVTLFLSAFLMFVVEFIMGALILPKLGGTPQVWNTCMVFYQALLLAGYAYAHLLSTWLPTRRQVIIQCVLLVLPLLVLVVLPKNGPLDISNWIPPYGANPIPATLVLLTVVVGLPFFVVSTSAPLLQKWFASTGHPAAQDPYFLYSASNLGSMLGLFSYPLFFEPFTDLHATATFDLLKQPWLWTVGYIIMMIFFFACAAMVYMAPRRVQLAGLGTDKGDLPAQPPERTEPSPAPATGAAQATAVTAAPPAIRPKQTAIKKGSKQGRNRRPQPVATREPLATTSTARIPAVTTGPVSAEITAGRRLRWVALAAVPSSLMLGVCTFVSTDISPLPFLWMLTLAFYILSFILVFSRWPLPWVDAPHRVVMLIQPAALLVLVYVTLIHMDPGQIKVTICLMLGTFFLTALACHGELAKDRPQTRHLTEFYLWMSFGGVVGGIFNALLAPILFKYVMEFSIALVVAGLVLPRTKRGGWTDDFLTDKSGSRQPQRSGPHGIRKSADVETTNPVHRFLDIALPAGLLLLALVLLTLSGTFQSMLESIGKGFGFPVRSSDGNPGAFVSVGTNILRYGIPLVIVFLYAGRPLRYGLGIAAVLLASGIYAVFNDKSTIFVDRSYYSIIRVNEQQQRYGDQIGTYTTLMHATTNHGMNFSDPPEWRRLASTYYHRASPVGYVMEKMVWFHDPKNRIEYTDPVTYKKSFTFVYWSDARMPASLVGLGAASLGVGNLPMAQLVGAWSEPAYATVGLGTGTMAVYAHPFQHMNFYEIDKHIRNLSLPPRADQPTYFTNVKMAMDRGVELNILMGDARLRMAQPWIPIPDDSVTKDWKPDDWKRWSKERWEKTGGPDHFYTALIVDAFSSDAIPIHLITKEAFQLYFSKLTEKGILCMHTSNRYVDLVRVCGDLATDLGYAWKRGHTEQDENDPGHFSSEWVMIARKPEYLEPDAPRPDPLNPGGVIQPHWAGCVNPNDWGSNTYWTSGSYVWTDDHHNMLSVFTPIVGQARKTD